jgi:putative methyltransferase (TIGR04325 family)
MSNLRDVIKSLPGVKQWSARRYYQRFLAGNGLHWGCYSSLAQARASCPDSPGFNRSGFQDEYIHVRTRQVYPFDYPVMYWLREATVVGATRIYDLGGSVGAQYYAYQPYLGADSFSCWRVSELPEAVARGRELAQAKGVSHILEFDDHIDPARIDADIFLCAGTLEFIEEWTLPDLLHAAAKRPAHILLNKLPLCERADFFSTQNIEGNYVPHRVWNKKNFIAEIESLGYTLHDHWAVPDRAFHVPGDDGLSFYAYSGLYFKLA